MAIKMTDDKWIDCIVTPSAYPSAVCLRNISTHPTHMPHPLFLSLSHSIFLTFSSTSFSVCCFSVCFISYLSINFMSSYLSVSLAIHQSDYLSAGVSICP